RGFAILRTLDDPSGNVLLLRIAVENPDQGFGQPFLRAVMNWVFSNSSSTYRLYLRVREYAASTQSSGSPQKAVYAKVIARRTARASRSTSWRYCSRMGARRLDRRRKRRSLRAIREGQATTK